MPVRLDVMKKRSKAKKSKRKTAAGDGFAVVNGSVVVSEGHDSDFPPNLRPVTVEKACEQLKVKLSRTLSTTKDDRFV